MCCVCVGLLGGGEHWRGDEPQIHPLLMKSNRALLVPHIGTHTFETLAAMETLAMQNAERAITEQPLLTVVPEQGGLSHDGIAD